MEDTDSHDDAQIGLLDLTTGRKEIIIKGGMGARYSPSGHIIYARKGKLLAVPFDLKHLEVTGAPFPVLEGVHMSATTGNVQFAISSSGTLVYAPGPVETGERVLTWVDHTGKATPFPLPARSYLHPRLSPDEQQLAVEVEGPTHNLFAYDFNRNTFTKLTFDGISHWPLWSPKGDRLAFRSMRTGFFTMWWMPWDRSASEKRLTDIGWWQSAGEFAPDGKALVFDQWTDPKTRWDVLVLPLEGENKPVPVAHSRFPEAAPRFSADGRWIAYCSLESGRPEVYVQQWPGPGPKLLISTEGGIDPMWAKKSGELFYRNGDKMMVCSMSTQPRLSASRPRLLWEGHYSAGRGTSCGPAGFSSSNYDVTADGKRFVMVQDKDEDVPATKLSVVLNWHEELKRRARARMMTE